MSDIEATRDLCNWADRLLIGSMITVVVGCASLYLWLVVRWLPTGGPL